MALLRSSITVGGYTMASRILGFVRDILIAAMLGAGPIADAFVVAFRLPNLFRRLVAEGAFSAAFVPLFARAVEERGKPAALAFASETLAVLLASLLAFTALAMAAMPWVIAVIAPGFVHDAPKFALAVTLTRITFPYLLFMALVALLSGILNCLYRFGAAAATPILLNVVLIAALLLPRAWFTSPGHALAWGVAVAGAVQFLWLAGACARERTLPRLPRPRLTPGVKRLLRLMLPGALGAGVLQINIVVGTMIASLLPTGAVAQLYYADRVYQLPLGVIGVALGTVLLPEISRKLRAGDGEGVHASQNRALEMALLVTLPAAAGLITLAQPIIVVLFERGAFGASAAHATASALAAFALGLPAYVAIKVLSPAFFAREDTATPVKAGIFAMLANLVLSLVLIQFLGVVGIGLATALSAWLNVALLGWWLTRAGHVHLDDRFRRRLPRIVLACIVMTVALAIGTNLLASAFANTSLAKVVALALLVGGGAALFGAAAILLKAVDPAELKRLWRRGEPA